MMVRIFIFPVLFSCLILLSPRSQVEAQSIPSPYQFVETRQEVGAFVGILNPGTGRFGYGPGEGVLFGLRYGVRLGGPFGLEGAVGYLPTNRDLIDPGRVEGDMKVGNPVDAEILTLDARLHFSLTGDRTWHDLNPFLFFGGGLAFDNAGKSEAESVLLEDDRFEFKNTFVGLIGGGVRWFLSERLLLRADGALSLWRLKTPNGFRDPERDFTGVGEKEWVSGPSLSMGISFHF